MFSGMYWVFSNAYTLEMRKRERETTERCIEWLIDEKMARGVWWVEELLWMGNMAEQKGQKVISAKPDVQSRFLSVEKE